MDFSVKKTGAAVLAALLVFGSAACGQSTDSTAAATASPEPTAETQVTASVTNTPAPAASDDASASPEISAAPSAEASAEAIVISYENNPVSSLSFMTSTVFQLTANVSGGTWTSSDASMASVDENGVVSCWKVGSPRITYTANGQSASVTLTITEATVSICFGGQVKDDISLSSTWGYEIQLEAVVTPAGSAVTWSSEDPKIASVSETGLVTGLKGGNTTITCQCGTAKATCIVRILGTPPAELADLANATPDPSDTTPRVIITYAGFANTDFTITVGTSVDMNYTLRNIDQNAEVVWSIENPAVATVNEQGIVTGKDAGTTKLIATCGQYSCECWVRVTKST